jgi:hypothetical protein
MKEENTILDPSYHQENPKILNDFGYVKLDLEFIKLKFEEYPDLIKNNPFFIYDYFSRVGTDKKEYKHIPPNLLKDPFFVSSCLIKNPDIYLLANSDCHSECSFLTIKEHHPNSYLKYAQEKDINNLYFCQEALRISPLNYRYLPDQFKRNHDIIKKVFYYPMYAEPLTKHIPKDLIEDNQFVQSLLNISRHVFPYLPIKYRDDEDLAFKMITKDTSFFDSASDNLKNNKDWLNRLFKQHKYMEKNHLFQESQYFQVDHILLGIPKKIFLESPEFYMENINRLISVYPKLSKEIRLIPNLIKSIFNFDPKEDNNSRIYETSFLNKIPEDELVKLIKLTLKNIDTRTDFYIHAQYNVSKLIDSYFLKKNLTLNIETNEIKTKTIKI